MRIAVAGNKGSFSHQAGVMYVAANGLENIEFNYVLDSEGVFAALTQQVADLGIVPMYNPTGGLVKMTLEAMGKHNFTIESTFDMPVEQCLLALPHARQDEIRTVVSHQQALAQCQKYLNIQMSDCQLVEYSDTAQAAADLATGKLDATCAVLAPKLCAQLYGLRVVAENIQDDDRNQTHFLVVKQHLPPNPPPISGEGEKKL
ncbi:MAG: chorismate mutase [Candidatus Kerfeldbacteria bacterium]|nr:chorismate mutase [Candidatus Kerfeldbacteria bacterium]